MHVELGGNTLALILGSDDLIDVGEEKVFALAWEWLRALNSMRIFHTDDELKRDDDTNPVHAVLSALRLPCMRRDYLSFVVARIFPMTVRDQKFELKNLQVLSSTIIPHRRCESGKGGVCCERQCNT